MSDESELVFETDLDAPPEKVWRALTVTEYLDRWLQPPADTKLEFVSSNANSVLTYRLSGAKDASILTLEIAPNEQGGTYFRLTHAPIAANGNDPVPETMMLAA